MSRLIVISGPSGCGKTTIAREILQRHAEILFAVSATTRPKRSYEMNGKDYFFLTKNEFEQKIRLNELVEWEQIYGEYYGSLKSEIDRAFEEGRSLLLDVDVKGALSIKTKYPSDSILIFIKPPSMEILRSRLMNRKTETTEALNRRLERVTMEMERSKEFNFSIINDDLAQAVDNVDRIINRAMETAV
ncbi:MAG: guanylate kinase [Ignavibacteria bacterium]|nr:guanylate kinase [Ignavibacteria bacterium]